MPGKAGQVHKKLQDTFRSLQSAMAFPLHLVAHCLPTTSNHQ